MILTPAVFFFLLSLFTEIFFPLAGLAFRARLLPSNLFHPFAFGLKRTLGKSARPGLRHLPVNLTLAAFETQLRFFLLRNRPRQAEHKVLEIPQTEMA